jgi:hypothetical protein
MGPAALGVLDGGVLAGAQLVELAKAVLEATGRPRPGGIDSVARECRPDGRGRVW